MKKLIIALLFATGCIAQAETPRTAVVGEIGILQGGVEVVYVAVDMNAFDKAKGNGDQEGFDELRNTMQLLPIPVGTKVRVLADSGFLGRCAEIRILEGPAKGLKGFVSHSFVKWGEVENDSEVLRTVAESQAASASAHARGPKMSDVDSAKDSNQGE